MPVSSPLEQARLTVNSFLHFLGSSVLSDFRRERLLQTFSRLKLPVANIDGLYEHFVWVDQPLDASGESRLTQLLD